MSRTEKQREASRSNGAKSSGPKSDQGKMRSSANGLKHGALARVHRPAGESEALSKKMEDALIDRYRPDGPGELELVRGMSGDLVRMQRLGKAERAAVGLARLDVGRSPDDDRRLAEAAVKLRGWKQLLELARDLKKRHGTPDWGGLRGLQDLAQLTDKALGFVGELASVETSHDGAERMVDLAAELALPNKPIKKRLSMLVSLCRAAIRYHETSRTQLVAVETERHRCQLDLAEIPDERAVRRFDKYRSAIEKSMLRRIEILKGLRDLGCTAPPFE